jgi:hypothetical protein
MICALTHDDPLNDCRRRSPAAIVLVISVGPIGLFGAGYLVRRMRLRGRFMRCG